MYHGNFYELSQVITQAAPFSLIFTKIIIFCFTRESFFLSNYSGERHGFVLRVYKTYSSKIREFELALTEIPYLLFFNHIFSSGNVAFLKMKNSV